MDIKLVAESILLGIIPETLFLYIFVKLCKNIKGFNFLLFLSLCLSYSVILFSQQNMWAYLLTPAATYLIFKLFGQSPSILDISVFLVGVSFILISSLIFGTSIKNLTIAYYIDRAMLLLIIILTRQKLPLVYTWCKKIWNRRDDGKMKSLTLRNIAVLTVFVVFMLVGICFKILGKG